MQIIEGDFFLKVNENEKDINLFKQETRYMI